MTHCRISERGSLRTARARRERRPWWRAALGALLMASLLLLACSDDDWTAIVYPDQNDRVAQNIIGEFEDVGECRKGVHAALDKLELETTPDYECGYRCKRGAGGRLTCEISMQ